MKKITPLIILSAICIVVALWASFPNEPNNRERSGVNLSWIMPLLLSFAALISYGIDRLIKKNSPDVKSVWVVEGILVAFIIFYAVFLK